MIDRATFDAARSDVDVFARALVGEALWPHQLEVARSEARIRCICSGRQAGKSRTMSVCALHAGFTAPERRVLILSAGEEAAKDLLAEITLLASAPLLLGSVVDANKSQVTLSNGSTIRSVPASQRQVRGKAIDLLIIDEAAFVDEEIWTAAKYTLIARPESRVLLASTPWGRQDRFFAVEYRAGLGGVGDRASFHWPSSASPMVDTALLETWRASSSAREWRQEVLAEWVEDAGAYFTSAELEGAVVDYELIRPEKAAGRGGVAGVDWAFAHDANAVTVLAIAVDGDDLPEGCIFPAWVEEQFRMPYARFVDRVCDVARGFGLARVVSEMNGVGAMPTQTLEQKLGSRVVLGVHTDMRLKEDSFGAIKGLIGQGRMVLPRHPELLRQLGALEFETRDSGGVSISVPERLGHDDLAMSLALATGEAAQRLTKPRRVLSFRGSERAGQGPRALGRGGSAAVPDLPSRKEGAELLRRAGYGGSSSDEGMLS